jgi:hypothetical protein
MRSDWYAWTAYTNTSGGVYFVWRRTREECLLYHADHCRAPVMKTGETVWGGWSIGPHDERCHEWGDTETRAPRICHVFQSSQNKARWVFCSRCEKHLQNGAPYRPMGHRKVCLECAAEVETGTWAALV